MDSELLMIKDKKGIVEPLDGFSVTLTEGEQGAKSLAVSGVRTEENKYGFDLIKQRNYFVYKDEEYIITKRGRRVVGDLVKIDCTNDHRFFDDLKCRRIYESYKGDFSPFYLLDMVFKGTGYKYILNLSELPETLKYDDFGSNNKLALFQQVIADLGAEFDYIQNTVYIGAKLGTVTDKQFLHKFNISDIGEDLDASKFVTYIKGYGKQKEQKDTSTAKAIPYDSKTGKYEINDSDNKPVTKEIGATFSFKFQGTGFSFKTIVHPMGGKWVFNVGGSNKTITTYAKEKEEKVIEVARGMDSKEYTVKATFKKDTDNPNTKKKGTVPFNYLLDGGIITPFRELVGDERYSAVIDYTSPLAEEYGIIEAEPFYSDDITNASDLKEALKKALYDSWDISISLTAQDLEEMNLNDINRLDYAYCLLDPLGVDVLLKVVEKVSYSNPNISPKFTFGTIKKKGTDTIAGLSSSSKAVSKLVDQKTGKIKESALAGTVSFNLAYATGVLAPGKVRIGPETLFEDGYDPKEIAAGAVVLADESNDGMITSEDFIKISKIRVDQTGAEINLNQMVVDITNLDKRLKALESK